jgi:hypothetical protein
MGRAARNSTRLDLCWQEKGVGAQGQNRTADTRIFSPLLYRLSYLGVGVHCDVLHCHASEFGFAGRADTCGACCLRLIHTGAEADELTDFRPASRAAY